MKNKSILITAIFLIVTTGNFFLTNQDENVKSVSFISILAIGALSGILLMQIVKSLKNNKKKE